MPSILRHLNTMNAIRNTRSSPSTLFSPIFRPLPYRSSPLHLNLNLTRPRTRLTSPKYPHRPPPPPVSPIHQTRINNQILYALLGVNFTVFGIGAYLQERAKQGYPRDFAVFMQAMTLNLSEFNAGAYWQLLTMNFTHLGFLHLFSNAVTAYFLGQFLTGMPAVTPARFLAITLGSGIAGSLGFLADRATTVPKGHRDAKRGLGFSGCVMGISTVAACLQPTARVLLYGIIPVPLWGLVAGYAVYDGYYMRSQNSNVSHSGHLGGMLFGLAYYGAVLRGIRI